MIATATAVAFVVFSCKGKLAEAEGLDISTTPTQVINDMFAVVSKNGTVNMRLEADLMERYEDDSLSQETFPKGISVYSYTSEGLLETCLFADDAKHITEKKSKRETWMAYGNVVIQNTINRQTMETDTIYWDKDKGEIYTDCYVRIYSPDGLLQGYGMKSDEKASNAIIRTPFNSIAIVKQDSTVVMIESVNFIGPFRKR